MDANMVSLNFLYALLFVGLTAVAVFTGQDEDARTLLFYAGALFICALFSLKSRKHGLVGAAVLSSLALFSGASRLWGLLERAGEQNPTAFLLNIAATGISAGFLFCSFLSWQKQKRLAPPEDLG